MSTERRTSTPTWTSPEEPEAPAARASVAERTRTALLRAIRSGAFADGRLPAESDVALLLGVSRTSVRSALQSIEADGLITRRRGAGTHVNSSLLRSSMPLNRMVAFTELIEQCGYEASADRQTTRRVQLEPAEAKVLGLEPGTAGLAVSRLLRAGGRPVISVIDLLSAQLLPDERATVPDTTSSFELLERLTGAPVAYATTEIFPRQASATQPEGLELTAGSSYVELVEVLHRADHTPVAVSRVSVDDDFVRLSFVRRRP